ncbi:MAG TPA: YkgJ family cysteine cluster protein, partial [Candidatus Lokiarchaeia archaeon]
LNKEELSEILGFYIVEDKIFEELKDKLVVSPLTTDKGLTYIGLLKKSNGQCYFYDDKNKKCLIYNLRPMFCRTFPFTFQILIDKEDKTRAKIKMDYTEKGKQYCPGIGPDAPLINEDEWIVIGKQTIEEMHYNHIIIEKWNEAVRKKKITPKAENFLFNILKLENQQQKKT